MTTQPLIFLDVDGVLNTGGKSSLHQTDRSRLLLLADLVNSTGGKIIVSSHWRTKPLLRSRLVRHLGTVGLTVSGWTPQLKQHEPKRRDEIRSYLRRLPSPVPPFVILDDIADAGQLRDNWVIVKAGLKAGDIRKAKEIIELQTI